MGANFAPSFANLAMGLWESQYIWHNNPFQKHLIFYSRYIDDIIIIWDGPGDIITEFVKHCNENPYGLLFTYVTGPDRLALLKLYQTNEEIHTTHYYKLTAGNSLLH